MSCRMNRLQIGLALLLGLAIASPPLMAIAQQYRPPRRGIPTRREGAGTRSPGERCMVGQLPLMGLTPSDNFSLTTAQKPVFFWFVPGTNAATAEFRLLDRTDQVLYAATVKIAGTPGVVSVPLPPPLANQMTVGKDYVWQLSLQCSTTDPSKNPFVEGLVQRTEPNASLRQALATATTPRDKATVYAEAGIWQEAIATLAAQRCRQPNDATLRTSWQTLLRSVALDRYIDVPLTRSCEAITP